MIHPGSFLIQFALNRPRTVTGLMVGTAAVLVVLAALVGVKVDTDPENMLSEHEAVRVFHDQTKKDFALHDVVVLGVVNEKHPDGVFNPKTLKNVQILTEFVATLKDPDDPDRRVVARDVIAPGNVDDIRPAGPGAISLEWLMKEAPATREGALAVRDAIMGNPLLKGTLASEDGRAMGIYIPITKKDFAHAVSQAIREKLATMDTGDDEFYITGLPVAEDTFGKEMFVQMAISAPLAMVFIFLLMLFFFKKIRLIIAPLIIAMVTVICTMGLLVATGNTVHIMSSMIPIFIMPIAVVDSIHILSEFFDLYQKIGERRKTIEHVMKDLFMPMLYTSLTSTAGFASLAFTPIPPVQVFGLFVAFGIMLAWLLTIVFIPAYVMFMKEESLEGFGASEKIDPATDRSILNRHLRWIGSFSFRHAKLVIAFNLITLVIAGYGISRIQVNDNPVKWFDEKHDIRIADRILNKHFAGTYEAYLVVEGDGGAMTTDQALEMLEREIQRQAGHYQPVGDKALALARQAAAAPDVDAFISRVEDAFNQAMDQVPEDDDVSYEAWEDALAALDSLRNRGEIFKRPDVLAYIEALQSYLVAQGNVGKSNSVADLVKKVHQELYEGDPGRFRIPDSVEAVAQCLIQVQSGHKPDDIWHLVSQDYGRANLWLQLRSGDNKDMESVIQDVERFFAENEPPVALQHRWAGLTYINVVWQEKMVKGMAGSFLSSFAVVFAMMVMLFRSPTWGALAMVPLTFTIAVIYGVIGLIGKDYDMPVAVLSSLTLGLAVDFAIHFLERARQAMRQTGDWPRAVREMFEEPARAISRNTIVIAVGFTPLLLAPLVPYQTVGIFLASIMFYSGLATMWVLPAMLTMLQGWLFGGKARGG